jgi:hypothetical protein
MEVSGHLQTLTALHQERQQAERSPRTNLDAEEEEEEEKKDLLLLPGIKL